MANNSGTACSTIEEMRESNRALIILSATYWVGADSISAPEQGRYGICPYSLDQTMIKTSNRIESASEPLVLKQNVPEKSTGKKFRKEVRKKRELRWYNGWCNRWGN